MSTPDVPTPRPTPRALPDELGDEVDDWDDLDDAPGEDDLALGGWAEDNPADPPEPWESEDAAELEAPLLGEPLPDEAALPAAALPEDDWPDSDQAGEDDWGAGGLLPRGRRLVAFRQTVQLQTRVGDWLSLAARCETGSALSFLRARVVGRDGARVSFSVGEQVVTVDCAEVGETHCQAHLVLRVAGEQLEVAVRLVDRESDVPLVLGRDLLAGRFVVDCAGD